MNHDVAIIIPTKNRIDWCILRTRFHAASKFTGHLLFIDSSESNPSDEFQKNASQIGAKNVTFIHLPSLGVHQSIVQGLRFIQDRCKYVVFSGDDDFHLPKGLTDCSHFLDENPQYFSVCGPAIISRMEIKETRGKIATSSNYWKKFEISEQDIFDRLNSIVQNYHNLEFALKRLDKYLEIMTQIINEFPSSDFSESTTLEYCSSLSIALEGRSGWVNTPFLIRGDHLLRPNSFTTKNQTFLERKNSLLLRNQRVAIFLKKHFKHELEVFSLSTINSILNVPLNKKLRSESLTKIPQWIIFQLLRIRRRSKSMYLGIKYGRYLKWIENLDIER